MNAQTRFRLTRFDTLPSTSDYLRDAADRDAPDGETALAIVQTAGRGSRGRSWFDAPGNLALSVLLRAPDIAVTTWPFVAALATFEALSRYSVAGLRLKWPNDVLAHAAEGPGKLAGILVETGASPLGPWVVIGIGANLKTAPTLDRGGKSPATALGIDAPVEEVATTLLERLALWAEIAQDKGFAPVRAAWLDAAHPPGTALVVTSRSGDTSHGRFAGLDADGALLLDEAGRVSRVATGDVLELARPG